MPDTSTSTGAFTKFSTDTSAFTSRRFTCTLASANLRASMSKNAGISASVGSAFWFCSICSFSCSWVAISASRSFFFLARSNSSATASSCSRSASLSAVRTGDSPNCQYRSPIAIAAPT